MSRIKKCKGTGKAKGHGCGVELPYSERNGLKSYKAKYGLGYDCKCFQKWASTTKEGAEIIKKESLRAKNKFSKQKEKEQRERMSKMKIDSMSPDKYRSKYVQPLINKIARLIDYGNPCVPTSNFDGKMNGGHYTSVGANRTICLNLHNIFIQSYKSNTYDGGDNAKYRLGLINIFGQEYLEYVEKLRSCLPIKLTKSELIEIKNKAQKICNDLEKNKKQLNPEQRILMRNKVNLELDIYPLEYSVYEWKK